MKAIAYWAAALLAVLSCSQPPSGEPADPSKTDPTVEPVVYPKAMAVSARVDGRRVSNGGSLGGVSLSPEIAIEFTRAVEADDASLSFVSFTGGDLTVRVSEADATVLLFTPVEALQPMKQYRFTLAQGECFGVSVQKPYTVIFTTGDDASQKFPTISDEALLDLVQEKTFGYFWDYAHPVSGLARERYGSGDTVTSGGSGFGIMALPVAVERGFITRAEAAARLRTILTFLSEKADRFHGVFPHWLNGTTGKVIPFSEKDNGGDLVETAFLMQGLLTVARYFDREDEADIRGTVDALWRAVEWDWYTRGGQDVLYWHWSPSDGWAMNMRITGWNEALIVYVLAASSPTHPVGKAAYDRGWASGGSMKPTVTGPLFFAHYSFLGLDPRKLRDAYADYWAQNVAHARYNYDYCVRNPGAHAGYGADCWGLTASDIPGGYTASSPTNDRGVIAPTAALASFPYTPQESLAALHTFYYILGDRLFGEYGFRDAFSLDQAWFASSYLAIDQGPIVVMIENYRSGLLWNLFMQDADIQRGLQALGFSF